MSRKMLINASESEEIRVAIVEGSILEEYYVERLSVDSCLGNIYKGRVTNVEPSIGAAFVEFGGPRHGFLHVSDVAEHQTIFGVGNTPIAGAPKPAAEEPASEEAEPREGGGRSRRGRRRGRGRGRDGQAGPGAAPLAGDHDPHDDAPHDAELPAAVASHAHEDESDHAAEEHDEPDDHDEVEDAAPDADLEEHDHGVVDVHAEADSDEDDAEDGEIDPDDSSDDDESDPDDEDHDDDSDADDESDDDDDHDADDDSDDESDDDDSDEDSDEDDAEDSRPPRSSMSKIDGPVKPQERRRGKQITDLMQKGSEIIVQVTKDGIGTKGPTLTTYLSLPGRYLVLMPGLDRRGVSRKIDDGKERDRLKKVLDQLEVREHLGFIVRTAGVGQSRAELQKDYRYLTKLWDRVEEAAASAKAPNLLYRESDLVIRTIRDIYTPDMGDIIVDNEDVARRAREFLATVMPKAVKNVKLYVGERPLFTAYGVEDEIGKLFLHRVELKSGGSLVIEQTEALVAIDVNSGRFRDEEDLEETAFKINCEAADAIARQLRLRDLGGVIVLDFIDMTSDKRRRALERHFRTALRADRARIKVARMSPFGTIEMTRQRVRPSLRQSIFQRCTQCRGVGYVATHETLCLNLVRQIKLLLARRNLGLDVYLNHENAEYFMNEKRTTLIELEKSSQRSIRVHVEADLRNDEFRVIPLEPRERGNHERG